MDFGLNMLGLPVGSLLQTRGMNNLGVLSYIDETNVSSQTISSLKEVRLSGYFIVVSELKKWEHLNGYKILTEDGTRWLIWTLNSAFGNRPECYVDLLS